MSENPGPLVWKYRETNDSEFARARFKCFEIEVQDCDGDMSRWHIKRGDQYVAMGDLYGIKPYHFDAAKKLAQDVLAHLWQAVEMNDFVQNELPKLKRAGMA